MLQVVAAILLILGSLLVLRTALRAEMSPPPRGRASRLRLVAPGASNAAQADENDWPRAA
jgi:hypothetical protein